MSMNKNQMHAVLDEMGAHIEEKLGKNRIFKVETVLANPLQVHKVWAGGVIEAMGKPGCTGIMVTHPLKRLRHAGHVIVAGARKPDLVSHLGFEPAASVEKAIAAARERHGRDASSAFVKYPMLACREEGQIWNRDPHFRLALRPFLCHKVSFMVGENQGSRVRGFKGPRG